MNIFTVPLEYKADEDGGTLEGYGSVFNVIDNQGDLIEPGAFKTTIRDRVPAGKVLLVDTHGLANGFPIVTAKDVVGSVIAAKENSRGLFLKAKFSKAESAQEIRTKVAEKHLRFMSIGYQPVRFRFEEREVDGQKALIRVIEEVKLGEVSIVAFPANELAAITAVKSAAGAVTEALEGDWTKEGAEAFVAAIEQLRETFEAKAAGWDAELGQEPAGEEEPDPDPALDVKADDADESDETKVDADDDETKVDDEPFDVKEWSRRANALLDDRDPDAMADPVRVAGSETRLEILERELGMERSTE